MTAAAAFEVKAYFNTYTNLPSHLEIRAEVADRAEAEAIVAQFPKSYGAKAFTGHVLSTGRSYAVVELRVNLEPNKNTGAKNENGIKRHRAFAKKAAALGHSVTFTVDRAVNAYQSETELNAALDA